jgi:hypothetical protein
MKKIILALLLNVPAISLAECVIVDGMEGYPDRWSCFCAVVIPLGKGVRLLVPNEPSMRR